MRGPGGAAARCSRRWRRSPRCPSSGRSCPSSSYVEAGRTLAYLLLFAAGVAAARLGPARARDRARRRARGRRGRGGLRARLARLAGHPRGERAVQPHRRAVPVLERRGHHRRAGRARAALARLAPHRAARSAARSPTRRWASASSRSCSPSRAAPSPPPRSPRSPGSRSCPLRLRSLPVLLAPAAAAGLVGAWALSRTPFSKTLQPLAAKESVAGDFGLLVLLMMRGAPARGPGGERRAGPGAGADARAPRGSAWRRWWWRCLSPLVGAHVGGVQRPRPRRLDRRPGGRAGERDRHGARAGRRPPHRRVVHPRQVLARGRPRVRRPARCWAWAPARSRSPGCATAPTPRSPATPTAIGVQTLADLGLVGVGAVARAARSPGSRRARAHHRALSAPPAPRGAARPAAPRLGPASGSPSSRSRSWRSRSGSSRPSTGPGSCPAPPRWRSWPPATWRAAGPLARSAAGPAPAPRGRPRRTRTHGRGRRR